MTPARGSWRQHVKVHPAAELFPLMSRDALRGLADDIKVNGLREPIIYFVTRRGERMLLDGRNRLDAMELAGLSTDTEGKIVEEGKDDPYAYAMSRNLHRRHLTREQWREVIDKVIAARPDLSNNAIARHLGVSDHTVASVRSNSQFANKDEPRVEVSGRKARGRKPGSRAAPPLPSPGQSRSFGGVGVGDGIVSDAEFNDVAPSADATAGQDREHVVRSAAASHDHEHVAEASAPAHPAHTAPSSNGWDLLIVTIDAALCEANLIRRQLTDDERCSDTLWDRRVVLANECLDVLAVDIESAWRARQGESEEQPEETIAETITRIRRAQPRDPRVIAAIEAHRATIKPLTPGQREEFWNALRMVKRPKEMSRFERWHAAVEELHELQAEMEAALEAMPEKFQNGERAERYQSYVDVNLSGLDDLA